MFIRTLGVLMVGAGLPEVALSQELRAKTWFTNPVYQLRDDRGVIVLVFSTQQGRKETELLVRRLNRISRRPDFVVIGLTRDASNAAEKFMKRNRIRFTVGAASSAEKDFALSHVPEVLYWPVGHRREKPHRAVELLESLDTFGDKDQLQETSEEREIKSFIESEANPFSRQEAIKKLWENYGVGDPQGFVAYAESRLPNEPSPWVRAQLRHQLRIAREEPTTEDEFNPSIKAAKRYQQKPDDPEWEQVRAMEGLASGLSPTEALSEYERHLSNTDSDMLIRRTLIFAIGGSKGDRSAARQSLMQILLSESDASNRLWAAGKLRDVCPVGDVEAADFLERLAAQEPHTLRTRPMMEAVAEWLRTGRLASAPDKPAVPSSQPAP